MYILNYFVVNKEYMIKFGARVKNGAWVNKALYCDLKNKL